MNVSASAGNAWDLEFAAPPGQKLQPGVYDNAARAPFRGSSPGMRPGRLSLRLVRALNRDEAADASAALRALRRLRKTM